MPKITGYTCFARKTSQKIISIQTKLQKVIGKGNYLPRLIEINDTKPYTIKCT